MSILSNPFTTRTGSGSPASRRDALFLALFAVIASLLAFSHYFFHREILLYGDATAHIGIARRVFDSRTPGFAQLGTVWLPLPHILMIPFILPIRMWQSGIGGSIPSMIAYVFGVLGMFRLVRRALPDSGAGRVAAWCAALIYALNPNLLYLQSTAMTEPLFLALFVWAAVFFSEFVQATRETGMEAVSRRNRALSRCGWTLMAAMLTRYDGWFAAAAFAVAAIVVFWKWTAGRTTLWRSPLRRALVRFIVILAVAPVLWFSYNAWNWKNPLEFATGPYSARAIADRTEQTWRHPGWHAPGTGSIYFLKVAKMNFAAGEPHHEVDRTPVFTLENGWLLLPLLGTVLLVARSRRLWPLLLLWIPLPFYALSIAWGGVVIYQPAWWPFSYYNVRYGLQLMPAAAALSALALYFAVALSWRRKIAVASLLALFGVFVGASYLQSWRATPISLREALKGSATRIPFERELASRLRLLPPGATLLIHTQWHAATLEFAGFPLRRTINENNDSLWQEALDNPARKTSYVLAFETPVDPVWRAVQEHPDELQLAAVVSGQNEPRAFLYQPKPVPEKISIPPVTAPAPVAAVAPNPANADKDVGSENDKKSAGADKAKPQKRVRRHVRRSHRAASTRKVKKTSSSHRARHRR